MPTGGEWARLGVLVCVLPPKEHLPLELHIPTPKASTPVIIRTSFVHTVFSRILDE